jgi:protocatechuate 3,4-dioxygenase beta subunit
MPPGATAQPPTFEGRPLPHPDEPVFDQGLAFDLETLMDRRRVLKALGYSAATVGLVTLAACAPGSSASPGVTTAAGTFLPTTGPTAAGTASGDSCAVIPEETAGPFPGDGSNGPDVLSQSGVVRSDIRSSFGSSTTMAQGVPLTIKLAIQDASNGCAPLANAAVYLWHCDRAGEYSMYGQQIADENYLRGVQAAGSDGVVTFTSIFPGCYANRYPHMHFEVYPGLDKAVDPANNIAISQIALPKDACTAVYASAGYEGSVANFARNTLAGDNVFGDDGGVHELGTATGDVTSGFTVTLAVPVRS